MIGGIFLLVTLAATAPDPLTSALEAGDLEEAASICDQRLREDPKDLDLLWIAARVDLRRGARKEAAARLRRLLELDPYNDDARLELARVLHALDREDAAEAVLEELFVRHPEHLDAMELRLEMAGRRRAESGAGPWQQLVRLALTGGVDTNASLDPSALATLSRRAASFMQLDLSYLARRPGRDLPFTLLGRLVSQQAMGSLTQGQTRRDLDPFMPTQIEVAAVVERRLGAVDGTFDLRLLDLYAGSFRREIQRTVRPTLAFSWPWRRGRRLEVLADLAWRQPVSLPGDPPTSLSPGLRLRHQEEHERWRLTLEISGLANEATGGPTRGDALGGVDPLALQTDYRQAGAGVYGELDVLASLRLVGLLSAAGRAFQNDGPRETTYQGLLGLRWRVARAIELVADYGYTRNVAGAARSYQRHQASLGARLWYR